MPLTVLEQSRSAHSSLVGHRAAVTDGRRCSHFKYPILKEGPD